MANNIKTIDDQVKTLVENIKKLQDEIKTYQSGYKAFEAATASLEGLAKTHGGLTESLTESLKKLEKIDAVTITKRIDEVANKLSSAVSMIEKLSKDLATKEDVAELEKQNTKILKQLAALDKHLDEGVSVKKKKLFM